MLLFCALAYFCLFCFYCSVIVPRHSSLLLAFAAPLLILPHLLCRPPLPIAHPRPTLQVSRILWCPAITYAPRLIRHPNLRQPLPLRSLFSHHIDQSFDRPYGPAQMRRRFGMHRICLSNSRWRCNVRFPIHTPFPTPSLALASACSLTHISVRGRTICAFNLSSIHDLGWQYCRFQMRCIDPCLSSATMPGQQQRRTTFLENNA